MQVPSTAYVKKPCISTDTELFLKGRLFVVIPYWTYRGDCEEAVALYTSCCADQAEPVQHGESVRLLVHCATVAEADRIIDGFGAEGKVIQRFTPHPPPDDAGMGALVQDKYGYVWILTSPRS